MANYNLEYQYANDIDWFFQYNDKFYHAASNGGAVPNFVDMEINRQLQRAIANASYISGNITLTNPDYADLNLSSFQEYARKGFISLDRRNRNDFDSQEYTVMAKPQSENLGDFLHSGTDEKKKELALRLKKLIPELDLNKYSITVIDINNDQII